MNNRGKMDPSEMRAQLNAATPEAKQLLTEAFTAQGIKIVEKPKLSKKPAPKSTKSTEIKAKRLAETAKDTKDTLEESKKGTEFKIK